MAASHRLGVSRVISNNRTEVLFPSLYLLKCQLSTDSQSVVKGANAYFSNLKSAMRNLNPLMCVATERVIRKVDISRLLAKPTLTLTDRILIAIPQAGQVAGLSSHGIASISSIMSDLTNADATEVAKFIPQNGNPLNPMATARALTLTSSGITLSLDAPHYRDGIVCHGMTELLAFQMCLPYCLAQSGDDVVLTLPQHTAEQMLDDPDLLSTIDISYGTDTRSDQRMTKDQANESSRSINEWEGDRDLERCVIKTILALIVLQFKLELDQLGDLTVETKSAASVASFGTQLLKQAGPLATVDWQLFKLMEAIIDSGKYMNPATVSQKWKEIRLAAAPQGLTKYSVDISNGAWRVKKVDDTFMVVRACKIA
ncbi:sigmaNS [Reptilian orthoreovirus]|uniref:SigmaNS n=1 Tax=chelonian orthoreovirus TaxID=3071237 RepID=A0A1D7PVI0_9REOV|nr:sigmaNS [Reptilian orthoreovirus]AOM63694.1 sigmaNS [chelonian orthoreovirus]